MNVFDPTLQGLTEALTLHQQRHEVLASNVANVETPGYRARELDFGTALRQAFDAAEGAANAPGTEGGEAAPRTAAPPVVDDPTGPRRADGNTVDLDLQMTKLNANGQAYLALAHILGKRIALLRQAIEGTR